MKILFFAYEYPPLGTGVANAVKYIFAKFSESKDLQVDFITASLENKFEEISLYPNIRMLKVPIGLKTKENEDKQKPIEMIRFIWHSFWLARKLIRENHYDLAHFFGYPGGFVTYLLRRRVPYIVSLRGVDVPGYNPTYKKYYVFYRPLAYLIWKHAERVIPNSQGLKELARETAPDLRIDVIPNGIDTRIFKPVPDSLKTKNFTITAGATTMTSKKGLPYLVKGFAKLHAEYRDTELVLIGGGSKKPEIEDLVSKLNLQESVRFLGRKPKAWVPENLPRYHVLCLPSINEGMSNAALEAMASGLPLILTETGGTVEMLEDGVNGYIINKRDEDQIYEKLKILYKNPKKKKSMGEKSREKAMSMDWDNIAKQHIKVYQDVIRKADQ
ncbi:glycosyltransferase [Candidatus Dojkabacteria bacterium]|nr:glycosyltransferase [Candidatus Dojkabacteria bacterium]